MDRLSDPPASYAGEVNSNRTLGTRRRILHLIPILDALLSIASHRVVRALFRAMWHTDQILHRTCLLMLTA